METLEAVIASLIARGGGAQVYKGQRIVEKLPPVGISREKA